MGLSVEVGLLVDLTAHDPDGADNLRDLFGRIGELLTLNGARSHVEPEALPELQSRCSLVECQYSDVMALRRAYAHTAHDPDWVATPAPDRRDADDVAVIRKESLTMSSHLLSHSLYEGFYVPVDFDRLILGDSEIGILGSSHALHRELALVASKLGVAVTDGRLSDSDAELLDRRYGEHEGLWQESLAWLLHWEAARLSIEHQTAIVCG